MLIAGSSLIDYLVGRGLSQTRKYRRLLLAVSLVCNLGVLGFFKYYGFFLESFLQAFSFLGVSMSGTYLQIILPVGISFYTFQTLSYTIDIYRRELEPTTDLWAFMAYVGFFPQLVAGPIERASHLLPQFLQKREFSQEKATDGLRQMLWGFFKKMVIADNCAVLVNDIFEGYQGYNGSTLLLGVILFTVQIYCDFSGYSDIAIGTGRLFGFDLRRNFRFPFFATDIADFWRRWHISLTTWFRDYVYIPLGGRGVAQVRAAINVIVVFGVSGLWHGANWTFVFWGLIHAFYLLLYRFWTHLSKVVDPGPLHSFISRMITFSCVVLAFVTFRSENVSAALNYYNRLFSTSILDPLQVTPHATLLVAMAFLLSVEWFQRHKQHGLDFGGLEIPKAIRWTFYYGLIAIILWFRGSEQDFIYFQF